ncbi:hypothetical protein I314_01221 [Cryptococcus bacillisporus CA1873]|uniref:Nucleoporin Nup54 alpha-helical domain-containing protein n=1 Tax=Cryptococcus bacillisporus CA1873 TaxID=1296111 RepID=A0ABR5BHZ9_CRYGA|nr:hypothetical protein I314_01221 [Cryptococcus bacillisporus CA1873]|eukprot:KIR68796.1 hypothetical protein I314_01221 [Cryptococcus gattii CA1873]
MSFGGFGQAAGGAKPLFGGFGQQPSTTLAQPATTGGSGGLFGSQSQPQQQQQQQPQQQPTGGLFGSQPKPAGTGLFGSTSTAQPQQPQGQQGGGGLFGSNTGAGAAGAGGGLFGSTQQQQQPQAGGGLFGSTVGTAGTVGTSTGGLFGQQNQTQPKPAGGLFGSTAVPAPGGGGLFGSTLQQPQQAQQQQQQQGLFGSTTQPAQTGGLFGSTAQQQQPQQQQQQQQQQGGGLFGNLGQSQAKPAGGLFGASAFGAPQQPPLQPQGGGLFGSAFGQSTNQVGQLQQSQVVQPSMQQSVFGVKKEMDIESRIKAVQDAWDSSNPDCRFKYFFYNVVEEGTANRYARPAGANDDAKWAKALRDNPDPNSMVPVLAVGWADVKKRQQLQENLASVHQERIKEIAAALAHTRQTSLSSSIRLANLQARQSQLVHRLIHLAAQTPQHVPIIQSTVFKQEEADMAKQLEGVKAELEGHGRNSVKRVEARGEVSRGRLLGQVNELWGQLEEIRRKRKVRGPDGREQWIGDEKMLGEIAEVLATQQTALQKLSDLVQDANLDADVMLSHGGER